MHHPLIPDMRIRWSQDRLQSTLSNCSLKEEILGSGSCSSATSVGSLYMWKEDQEIPILEILKTEILKRAMDQQGRN